MAIQRIMQIKEWKDENCNSLSYTKWMRSNTKRGWNLKLMSLLKRLPFQDKNRQTIINISFNPINMSVGHIWNCKLLSKWLEWLIMEWSDKNITFIQVYMYKNLNHYTTLKFLNFNTLQWSVLEIIFLSIIIYDFNPYQSNLFPYHSFSMFLLNHFFVICFYIFFNSYPQLSQVYMEI